MTRFDRDFEFDPDDLRDPARRRTAFRDVVKDIRETAKDDARFRTVDVNGTLTRAMEMAFKAGLDMGRADPSFTGKASAENSGVITEKMIPSLARNSLTTLSIWMGMYDRKPSIEHVRPVVLTLVSADPLDRSKMAWMIVMPEQTRRETMGLKSLSPLQRLGFLALDDSGKYLMPTHSGLRLSDQRQDE